MRDGWLSDIPTPPQYVYYFFTSNGHTQDAIHTLSRAKFKEGWEGTQRELARQAELPSSGRGSAIHFRLSNVLNYAPEGDKDSAMTVLSGARRHKASHSRHPGSLLCGLPSPRLDPGTCRTPGRGREGRKTPSTVSKIPGLPLSRVVDECGS